MELKKVECSPVREDKDYYLEKDFETTQKRQQRAADLSIINQKKEWYTVRKVSTVQEQATTLNKSQSLKEHQRDLVMGSRLADLQKKELELMKEI